jgi:hypothetical protein
VSQGVSIKKRFEYDNAINHDHSLMLITYCMQFGDLLLMQVITYINITSVIWQNARALRSEAQKFNTHISLDTAHIKLLNLINTSEG